MNQFTYHILLSILFFFSSFAYGYETTYPIEGKLLLPDRIPASDVKVSMNGGEYVTYTKADGSFNFHDVIPGIYLLDILSTSHYFSQVKVNLPSNPAERIRCIEYQYPGANKQPLSYPMTLTAHAPTWYFEKREQFGIHTLFKNPMMFMVVLTLGMIVIFPKMMKNMDPEALKEMQEQMENSQDMGKMFSSMFEDPDANKKKNIKESKSSKKSK
mmetsp:Transcript_22820/g.29590  ORF Transcript_22820/g.29590 Transcript_22820/m.29590 type:complete len:214 (+) Transcript_22820:85-726(+)